MNKVKKAKAKRLLRRLRKNKRIKIVYPSWAKQFLVFSLFLEEVKLIILDVDDTLIRSEELQKESWLYLIAEWCLASRIEANEVENGDKARALTEIEAKKKILKDFIEDIFHREKGDFSILTPGMLYFLAQFRWLPKRIYDVWNPEVIGQERYRHIMGAIELAIRRRGIDPCAINHIQPMVRENADYSDILPGPKKKCPEVIRACQVLEEVFTPIRKAQMVGAISQHPAKYICEGASDFLLLAKKMGKLLAIFTNSMQELSLALLYAAFGEKLINELFPESARSFGDHYHKPEPFGWVDRCRAAGVSPRNTLIADDRLPVLIEAVNHEKLAKWLGKSVEETEPFLGAICIMGEGASEDSVKGASQALGDFADNVLIVPNLRWARLHKLSRHLPH